MFIRSRTEDEIAAAARWSPATLPDPLAENANLTDPTAPASDENRALSADGVWLVQMGVCTHLAVCPWASRAISAAGFAPATVRTTIRPGASAKAPRPATCLFPSRPSWTKPPSSLAEDKRRVGIPHDHYEPKTRGEKWLNRRLPIVGLLYGHADDPTPKNLNWMWIFGIVLTFTLVMQIVTASCW